jgi:hypothetical protein
MMNKGPAKRKCTTQKAIQIQQYFTSVVLLTMFPNMFKYVTDSVADPHHFNADPDPTFHFDGDPDPAGPLMRIRILIFTLIQIRTGS